MQPQVVDPRSEVQLLPPSKAFKRAWTATFLLYVGVLAWVVVGGVPSSALPHAPAEQGATP